MLSSSIRGKGKKSQVTFPDLGKSTIGGWGVGVCGGGGVGGGGGAGQPLRQEGWK